MPDIIRAYCNAINAKDIPATLECRTNDVAHHVNEGQIRLGKDKFRAFCDHMSHCYKEELTDMVVFYSDDQTRAAAEYIVNGTYISTDPGLPEATGQTYRLPAGSFFSLKNAQITRVVTFYNLAEWRSQVS